MSRFTLVPFLCVFWATISHAAYSPANEKAIRDTVIDATYDPVSRPTTVTNVNVKFSVISITKVDLKLQTKQLAGWLTMKWVDSRLTWTPATSNDIEHIFVTPASVWKPEVTVDNSVADLGVVTDSNLQLRVKYDGTVEWEPPRLFTVHCTVDVTYYPYDQQKCGVEIISWGYRTTEVTLSHLASAINMENYIENGEWVVTSTKLETSSVAEEADGTTVYYPKLDFWIYLKRRPDYYVINNILPIILSSFLMLVVFALPADSGEKASYALTVLLALAVLLTIIADKLPETSLTTSILGIYLAVTLIIASIITVITVWILILHNRKSTPDYSSCFYRTSLAIGRIVHVTSADDMSSGRSSSRSTVRPLTPEPGEKMDEDKMAAGEMEWPHIAAAWDRFFLYIFFAVVLIVTVVCMLVISVGGYYSTPV